MKLTVSITLLDGHVLLWKKGQDILAVGEQIIEKTDRKERLMRLEKKTNGNELIIPFADQGDEGEYVCQVSAYVPRELKHTVKITG